MANILLGVTGCIAAYKAADITSALRYEGHEVKVIMTENAKKFITPLTLATLSNNPVYDDSVEWATMPRDPSVKHVELAKWGDLLVICPATANTISKMRYGMADNLLTSMILAFSGKPLIVFPAMNNKMYEHPITQDNIRELQSYRDALNYPLIKIVPPVEGRLACGDVARGKLPSTKAVVGEIKENLKRRCSWFTSSSSLNSRICEGTNAQKG